MLAVFLTALYLLLGLGWAAVTYQILREEPTIGPYEALTTTVWAFFCWPILAYCVAKVCWLRLRE